MSGSFDVIIAGAGAAGMMCALTAAESGLRVLLLEKNEKAGKKLFITGKGRCNLTNASEQDTFFENIVTNSRFMNSSLRRFTNEDTMRLFESLGLKLKTERGNRVFPASDHSSDVIKVLLRALEKRGVELRLRTEVKELIVREGRCVGVRAVCPAGGSKREELFADSVVIATGGLSYPSTGSTGDGLDFAKGLGLEVTECRPSLVPMKLREEELCRRLQGLSLKNAGVTFERAGKKLYGDFGEMLFTHFGVSGPVILSASASLPRDACESGLILKIDLKPALDDQTLDKRILRDFKENENRNFANALNGLLPAKLIPVMVERSGIPAGKKVHSVTKEERKRLVTCFKEFELTVTGLRGFEEAVITKGGVSVKEIDPKTMGAKRVGGLYFIGEVLDVDALTGGFNLQIAWSTAVSCGRALQEQFETGNGRALRERFGNR